MQRRCAGREHLLEVGPDQQCVRRLGHGVEEDLHAQQLECARGARRPLGVRLKHDAGGCHAVGGQALEDHCGLVAHALEVGARHGSQEQGGGGLAKRAGRAAVGLPIDLSTVRVRRVRADAGQLDGPAVSDYEMAVMLHDQRGAVGAGDVEIVTGGKTRLVPVLVVEVEAHRPFVATRSGGCFAQAVANFLDAPKPRQIGVHGVVDHHDGVEMGVDEARQQGAAAKVHGAEVLADGCAALALAADGDDASRANADGRGPRPGGIERVDLAAEVEPCLLAHGPILPTRS